MAEEYAMDKGTGLIGFDLGATKMMAVLFDEDHRVVAREKARSKDGNGKTPVSRLVETIEQCLKDAEVEPKALKAVGIGVPGAVDRARGVVISAPNLGWENVEIEEKLEKALGVPVIVENDVNLGTYGEYRVGAARKFDHLLGIFPGTGVGGGLILDGRLYGGSTGMAGEIGHMILDRHGPLCGCGRYGCLEAYASRVAIAREAAAAALRGQAPALLEECGTDLTNIKSGAIARSIKSGDEAVEKIVRRAARMLGVAAANAVNLLSPEAVLLGGGLVEAMPALFSDEVEKAIRNQAFPALSRSVKVVVATLGDDAVATGAALFAEEMLRAKKEEKKS